jgi:hypothetical protein
LVWLRRKIRLGDEAQTSWFIDIDDLLQSLKEANAIAKGEPHHAALSLVRSLADTIKKLGLMVLFLIKTLFYNELKIRYCPKHKPKIRR